MMGGAGMSDPFYQMPINNSYGINDNFGGVGGVF